MADVAVLIAPRSGARTPWAAIERAAAAAKAAGFFEVILVLAEGHPVDRAPAGVIVVLDGAEPSDDATALQVAVDVANRIRSASVGVALASAFSDEDTVTDAKAWSRLLAPSPRPVVVGTVGGNESGLVRIEAVAWPLLPLRGGVERLWTGRSESAERRDLAPVRAEGEDATGSTEDRALDHGGARPPARLRVRSRRAGPLR